IHAQISNGNFPRCVDRTRVNRLIARHPGRSASKTRVDALMTRGSIAKKSSRKRWMAGSSPAMTLWIWARCARSPTQTGLSESNPGLDSAMPISAERSPGMQAPERSPGMQAPERPPAVQAAAVTSGRDLRLDLFRGIALWLIFLDHIPSNLVAWGTIRNYGFSDATEIFVFVSGYTAAFVYGKEMRERGVFIAGAHILRRVWQIYVAHVFLFAI